MFEKKAVVGFLCGSAITGICVLLLTLPAVSHVKSELDAARAEAANSSELVKKLQTKQTDSESLKSQLEDYGADQHKQLLLSLEQLEKKTEDLRVSEQKRVHAFAMWSLAKDATQDLGRRGAAFASAVAGSCKDFTAFAKHTDDPSKIASKSLDFDLEVYRAVNSYSDEMSKILDTYTSANGKLIDEAAHDR